MAKGDHSRVAQQITQQGNTEQNSQNALQNMLYGQNLGFQNNYNTGTAQDFNTYGGLNQNYGNMFNALASGQIGVGQGTAFGASSNQQQGGQQQSMTPQGGQQSFANQGGGWNQFAGQQGTPQNALQQAFSQGLSGQQAVDFANSSLGLQPPNSISANSDGSYGLPNGFYVAPNAQNGGQLDLIQRGGSSGGGNSLNGALGGALSGYQDFSQTGGYSPQDLQSIRDQAVAANQAAYKTGQSNLNQNREIQQFSPNYNAATANMARNMGYTNSNALTNANSQIAQMVQQGKLAGLSGMTGVGALNNQAQGMNLQAMLGALGGNTSLYGSTPGMGSTYGNQLLGSSNQMLGSQGTQNQLSQGLINGQLGESGVQGDFQAGLGNVMSGLNLAGGLLAPFTGGISGLASAGNFLSSAPGISSGGSFTGFPGMGFGS